MLWDFGFYLTEHGNFNLLPLQVYVGKKHGNQGRAGRTGSALTPKPVDIFRLYTIQSQFAKTPLDSKNSGCQPGDFNV